MNLPDGKDKGGNRIGGQNTRGESNPEHFSVNAAQKVRPRHGRARPAIG
jgi:hypothetical protein